MKIRVEDFPIYFGVSIVGSLTLFCIETLLGLGFPLWIYFVWGVLAVPIGHSFLSES